MILLWITLLLLHRGCALMSVTTAHLGETATFMCVFTDSGYSNTRVKWYKQRIGGSLELITTLMKGTSRPSFEKGFSSSRFGANHSNTMSTLTIMKTIEEDEAMYHCAVTTWSKDQWSGKYLSLKGPTHTRDLSVVQSPSVSEPVRPGDSVTLQCSFFSVSENKSCTDDDSVHWFGVRSDKSQPNVIYTDGSGHDECDKRSDTQRSCVYRFSKNVSSSDAGTYYCAVATCGEILFGNGTKLDIEGSGMWSFDIHEDSVFLLLLSVVLAISVIVIAILTCLIQKNKCEHCNGKAAVSLQESIAKRNLKRDEDTWMYSVVIFTMIKNSSGGTRNAKASERERIYAAVKAFGLD